MSGMSGFDRWLTTDTMAEAADAEAERLFDLWDTYTTWCNDNLIPEATDEHRLTVPPDADAEEHPDHGIYVAWLALQAAIDSRRYRLEADAEAAMYAEGEDLDREYDEHEDGLAQAEAEEAAVIAYEAAMEAKEAEMMERGEW